MLLRLFIIVIAVFPHVSRSQIALGDWRDHLAYQEGRDVEVVGDIVYCATSSGIIEYYKSDNTINRLSSVNYLSDLSPTCLHYNTATGWLVIGYENGNVDLLKGTTIVNIPFIKTTTNIIGNKEIHDAYSIGDLVYLSCGFGIVVVDMTREEIKDTYIIGPGGTNLEVYSIVATNDTIFAGTEMGLYKADVNNQFLADFNAWEHDITLPDSIENEPINNLFLHQGDLYLNADRVPYNGDIFYHRDPIVGYEVFRQEDVWDVSSDGMELLLAHNGDCKRYDLSGNVLNTYYFISDGGFLSPRGLAYEAGDIKWLADSERGLVRFQAEFNSSAITPSGPGSNICFDMDSQDGYVYTVNGAISGGAWLNNFSRPVVSAFSDNDWTYDNVKTEPGLDSLDYYDLVSVAVNPSDPTEVFTGSMSFGGLFHWQNGQLVNRYETSNSSLQDRSPTFANYIAVTGLDFDSEGNLWVSNAFCDEPLSVRTSSGSWRSFYLGNAVAGELITDLKVDPYGQIWMIIPGSGVMVYNPNGTVTDDSDDSYRLLTSAANSGGIQNIDIESMAIDQDGEVWLGTQDGIEVIFASTAITQGSTINAQQILLEQDGNIQVLLEGETVTAIEIDGGNRKWLGTSSGGIFLMSEDGTQQIRAFNESNSPLLDNTISAIEVNGETGEVFIGTEKGVVSYMGDATDPDPFFTEVYAYPNPVTPEFSGTIAIKGLAVDSYVKIADAAGNVVLETRSEGGIATWNGNRYSGERVSTGVYYVFATDAEGKEGEVARILVVK